MKEQVANADHTKEYEKMFREMCKVDNVKSEFPQTEEEAKLFGFSTPTYLLCPSGYEFRDENGNVINAKKVVLEKKKPRYPKTEDECMSEIPDDEYARLRSIIVRKIVRLICCRNAYWKLAGDWKPNWAMYSGPKHCIIYSDNEIKWQGKYFVTEAKVLAFPTEEMRDAFYENFKELIEECKELL